MLFLKAVGVSSGIMKGEEDLGLKLLAAWYVLVDSSEILQFVREQLCYLEIENNVGVKLCPTMQIL